MGTWTAHKLQDPKVLVQFPLPVRCWANFLFHMLPLLTSGTKTVSELLTAYLYIYIYDVSSAGRSYCTSTHFYTSESKDQLNVLCLCCLLKPGFSMDIWCHECQLNISDFELCTSVPYLSILRLQENLFWFMFVYLLCLIFIIRYNKIS